MAARYLEHGDDGGLLRAGTHRRAPLPPFACSQPQRIQQDRFARARLAGEHIQTRREGQLRLFNKNDVANTLQSVVFHLRLITILLSPLFC